MKFSQSGTFDYSDTTRKHFKQAADTSGQPQPSNRVLLTDNDKEAKLCHQFNDPTSCFTTAAGNWRHADL